MIPTTKRQALSRPAPFLIAYIFVPVLLGWFVVVLLGMADDLRPGAARMPTATVYDPSLDDFVVFYAAGSLALDGNGDLAYDLDAIHAAEARTLAERTEHILVLPFFNPPFAVLPLAALGMLPFRLAAAVWIVAGFILAAIGLGLVVRTRPSRPEPAALAAWGLGFAASLPFYQTLLHGQASAFLLAGWILLWFGAFAERHDGLTLGGLLLLAFKPQFALLPVAYVLAKQGWRPLRDAAAVLAVCTALAIVLFSPQIVPDYLRLGWRAAAWDDENGVSTWGMFGWNAFSRGLLGANAEPRMVLTVALDMMTFVLVLMSLRKSATRSRPENEFAIVVFASLLVSPHLYAHDLLVAALPVFLLATCIENSTRLAWSLYAIAGWWVLYFHFDILSGTAVNAGALWLAGGMVAASGLVDARGLESWRAAALGRLVAPRQVTRQVDTT